jgi:hypothetical protein
MIFTRCALLILLPLAACAPAERSDREPPESQPAGLVADRAAAMARRDPCDSGSGVRATWRPGTPPVDRGIGVLTFPSSFVGQRSDTMTIRATASVEAAVVARYILRKIPEYSWCYRMEVSVEGITDNSLEIGYESIGLPFDSLAPSHGWARVIFGFDQANTPKRGWVELRPERTRGVLWADHFREMGGFLWNANDLEPEFADSPNGSPVALDLARNEAGSYSFEADPVEFVGPWMRVRIRTPTGCVAPDSLIRETTAWIRYLTEAGRPAVWYATRGC